MGLFSALGGVVGSAFGMPGVGAAVGGLIDGSQAQSQANKSSAAQDALLGSQKRLYDLQANMGEHFFDQYQTNYEPLALSQLAAARAGVDPNYYASLADNRVVQQQGLALDAANRNMERAGVSPADGRWMAMQNQNALALAGNRVAGQNQARQAALEQNWNRRNQQVDYGANLVNRGSGMMSGAASGMSGLAGAYGQQAVGAGTAAGYSFNNAARDILDAWKKPKDPMYGNQTYTGGFGGGFSNGGFGGY